MAFCNATAKLSEMAKRKGPTMTELTNGCLFRLLEVSVALVGAMDGKQVENIKHVAFFTKEKLAQIDEILSEASSLDAKEEQRKRKRSGRTEVDSETEEEQQDDMEGRRNTKR